MRNLAERKRQTSDRWRELISGLGTDELASAFVVELKSMPSYRAGLIEDDELLASARSSFALLLEAVSTGTTTTSLSPLPAELGRLRAHQGIPVEDFVSAVRLDFKVIWSALLWRATAADMTVLAVHVDSLWSVVDDYVREVHQSYLEEKAVMAASTRGEQQIYLAELFGPAGQIPSKLVEVARALAVDVDGTFRVVATAGEHSRIVHRAIGQCLALGAKMFVVHQHNTLIVLWPASEAVSSQLESEPQVRLLDGVVGGILPTVSGLANVPAAAVVAQEIHDSIQPGEDGLVPLQQAWARVTRGRLDSTLDFSADLLAGLDDIGPDEKDRIIETVRAYMATGSATEAAAVSFCHRNTVLNRLSRFAELTGLNVTVPEQAALALLALA